MEYSKIAEVYEKIESTTKRLEITDYLVELLKNADPSLIKQIVYLTQGRVYPEFTGIELGIAEKLVISAISFGLGINQNEVNEMWIKEGDLGIVSANFVKQKKQCSLFTEPLTVERVYSNFESIAKATGKGAQDLKIKLVANLLHDATPSEAKYIVRTIIGKLRLGVADMTLLDALVISFADKSMRDEVERAYNVCSDLGVIAELLASHSIEELKSMRPRVGIPIRAMLAERLSSLPEIFEKMDNKCCFEYKYDGLRIQAHINPKEIILYSRRLENVTSQFPDIQNELRNAVLSNECILEGECVPINPDTNEFLPFQEISHRRGRKYDLKDAIEEYPVILILFDCLYCDGVDFTRKNYIARREALAKAIRTTEKIKISEALITDNIKDAENFFEKSIEDGCEGVIAKSIGTDSLYKAGARGWQWIKYKREYKSEMTDSADLVVVGAFAGKGRRTGSYGALLMAAYNDKNGLFETVCKLGTGFDDKTLHELPTKFKDLILKQKDRRIVSTLKPEYWMEPKIVLEVVGAEITLSPVHTCGFNKVRENAGLAIRFPRFTGNWRDDKSPEDATTVSEIIDMYKAQLKKMVEK